MRRREQRARSLAVERGVRPCKCSIPEGCTGLCRPAESSLHWYLDPEEASGPSGRLADFIQSSRGFGGCLCGPGWAGGDQTHLQKKPESWNVTVFQAQPKESRITRIAHPASMFAKEPLHPCANFLESTVWNLGCPGHQRRMHDAHIGDLVVQRPQVMVRGA